MSFPYNNWRQRAIVVGLMLLLVATAMYFIPRTANLASLDFVALSGVPVNLSTHLVDLAHAPAPGQPAIIPLARAGDSLVFSGHSQVNIPTHTLPVAADTTIGQVTRWVGQITGWPARISSGDIDHSFQFDYGSATLYRFKLVHHRDIRPILAASGVAWLVAIAAWAAEKYSRPKPSHG